MVIVMVVVILIVREKRSLLFPTQMWEQDTGNIPAGPVAQASFRAEQGALVSVVARRRVHHTL